MRSRTVQSMIEYGLATVLLSLLFLLSLPFVVRLFTLGSLSTPLSLLLLIAPALMVGIFSFRIHRILEPAFSDTFIPEAEVTGTDVPGIEPVDTEPPPANPLMSSTIGRMLSRLLAEDREQEDEAGGASTDSGGSNTPGDTR